MCARNLAPTSFPLHSTESCIASPARRGIKGALRYEIRCGCAAVIFHARVIKYAHVTRETGRRMFRDGMGGFLTMRSSRPIPTQEDFETYRGAHTHRIWASLPPQWQCPSCGRTRFQLLTWTKSLTDSAKRVFGDYHWLAAIHEHHDHHSENGSHLPRFAPTFICGDCNSADGAVKRRFQLPADFSFSPQELSKFVAGRAHD